MEHEAVLWFLENLLFFFFPFLIMLINLILVPWAWRLCPLWKSTNSLPYPVRSLRWAIRLHPLQLETVFLPSNYGSQLQRILSYSKTMSTNQEHWILRFLSLERKRSEVFLNQYAHSVILKFPGNGLRSLIRLHVCWLYRIIFWNRKSGRELVEISLSREEQSRTEVSTHLDSIWYRAVGCYRSAIFFSLSSALSIMQWWGLKG